jgi:hypothetical protein
VSAVRALLAAMMVVLMLAASSGRAGATSKSDETERRLTAALEGLQTFNGSRSLEDLHRTINKLPSAVIISAIAPQDYAARRRETVQAWVSVFQALDKLIDPTFDPTNVHDLPQVCVVPPREPSGRRLPACANPADIPDEQTRNAYIAAIQANDAKIQRANLQGRLRVLEQQAAAGFQANLRTFQRVAPGDAPEVNSVIGSAGLSAAMQGKLRATVDASKRQQMTRGPAIVTFEKKLREGVSVRITGIPAHIVKREDHDDPTLFDKKTGYRLERLLRFARSCMSAGETDIRLDFADAVGSGASPTDVG